MSTDANKAVVRRCLEEVWTNGNLDSLPDLVDENVYIHNPRNRDENLQGIAGLGNWVATVRQAIPDLTVTPQLMIAQDDRVMVHAGATGTHRGPLKGVAATEAPLTFTVTAIVRLRDGKITESWAIADTLGILRQVGAMPAPGG